MFCKNCGSSLAQGQTFCPNCGAKNEENTNNNVANTSNNLANTNVNSNGVNSVNTGQSTMESDNMQSQMNGVNNQMGVNNTPNPMNTGMNNASPTNGTNVPNTNSTNNTNNNGSKNMIIIAVIVLVLIVGIGGGAYFIMSKSKDEAKNSDTSKDKTNEVSTNSNTKLYKGYNFIIPNDYTLTMADEGYIILTKGDVTYWVDVDNSSYEDNVQYILSQRPDFAADLESNIGGRKVAAMMLQDKRLIFFTKASDTQIFQCIVGCANRETTLADVTEIINILNNTKKADDSSFANDDTTTGSNFAITYAPNLGSVAK